MSWLLERYSGAEGWQRAPNTDARFAEHFAPFNPNGDRNQLYVSAAGVALVQHEVGLGKLVLWIEGHEYPALLSEYRRRQRS